MVKEWEGLEQRSVNQDAKTREKNQCEQGWLCGKINKIDKPTTRLTKKKGEKTHIKNKSKTCPPLTFQKFKDLERHLQRNSNANQPDRTQEMGKFLKGNFK